MMNQLTIHFWEKQVLKHTDECLKNSTRIDGKKGVLWWQIDDVLRKKRPSYVILENVDRLIRSPANQCGRDFSIIIRCFYQKGYMPKAQNTNSTDAATAAFIGSTKGLLVFPTP